MITLQSKSLALRPAFKMQPIRADEALGRFRWLVAKMLKDEAAESTRPGTIPIAAVPT